VIARSFDRQLTVTASTKRPPAIASGRRGAPVENVADMPCTPLWPLDSETRLRVQLDTPHELRQTFAPGDYDVREGDVLVVDEVEYPIRSVADWAWSGDANGAGSYLQIVVEELKAP
jgi:hypothetical protein